MIAAAAAASIIKASLSPIQGEKQFVKFYVFVIQKQIVIMPYSICNFNKFRLSLQEWFMVTLVKYCHLSYEPQPNEMFLQVCNLQVHLNC